MGGTTLCPHCTTRFKITPEQLEAHQGMVRCGHCLQAFDARPSYLSDQPSPQLELPIHDESAAAPLPAEETPRDETAQAIAENGTTETPRDDLLDFNPPPANTGVSVARPMTLAEQIAVLHDDEEGGEDPRTYRKWPWAIAAFLLLLALLAQAAYFFRVDLAARLPALKPALTGYCNLMGCSVPLPRETAQMSIESSDLEADSEHENRIILNALLRNRAPYAQAFPHLELTLNETNDNTPLARRSFKPEDYLPPQENQQAGMPPGHEVIVKLHLGTADLRPTGYRLALYYP